MRGSRILMSIFTLARFLVLPAGAPSGRLPQPLCDGHQDGSGGKRAATSAISCCASTRLEARGSSRCPSASTSSRALSSWPKVAGPILPTNSGTPLRARLALPLANRAGLSAKKPPENRPSSGGARRPGQRGQDVGVFDKVQHRRLPRAVLFDLAPGLLRR